MGIFLQNSEVGSRDLINVGSWYFLLKKKNGYLLNVLKISFQIDMFSLLSLHKDQLLTTISACSAIEDQQHIFTQCQPLLKKLKIAVIYPTIIYLAVYKNN